MKIQKGLSSVSETSKKILFLLCIFASISPILSKYRIVRPKPKSDGKTTPRPEISSNFKPSRLCSSYTSDSGEPPYRFHPETRRCYMVGDRGPCPDLMKFSMVDADYGTCDCDQSRRCGRPLVYWPRTKSCYFVNDQGPCAHGKWLVFGFDLRPTCKTNRCLTETTDDPSRERRFWYYYQGKCYKTYTQGYCKSGEILFNNWREYRPTCNKEASCQDMSMSGIQTLNCLPGSRKDHEGKCSRNYIYKD